MSLLVEKGASLGSRLERKTLACAALFGLLPLGLSTVYTQVEYYYHSMIFIAWSHSPTVVLWYDCTVVGCRTATTRRSVLLFVRWLTIASHRRRCSPGAVTPAGYRDCRPTLGVDWRLSLPKRTHPHCLVGAQFLLKLKCCFFCRAKTRQYGST